MEGARKVAAIILGVVVLVGIILAARWTGEQIRQRFFAPRPTIITSVPAPAPENQESLMNLPKKSPVATTSAIPKTGPAEVFYLFSGLAAASGIVLRRISS